MGDIDLDRKKKIMSDEYIRKADAIKQCGFGMTSLHIADNLRKMQPADVVPVNREKLMAVLRDYFSIGDSYTYELTRVKSAFEVGTMSLDDFKEWEEEDITCLCDYILRELRMGNISAERGDNNVAES